MAYVCVGQTQKRARLWQGQEQPFGCSGKSQPEARIPSTQCKEEGQVESLGTALSWHHGVADRGNLKAVKGLEEHSAARLGAEDLLAPVGPGLSSKLGLTL